MEMEVCCYKTRLRGLRAQSAEADFVTVALDFNRGRFSDRLLACFSDVRLRL
jgi:hypothetical protein